MPRISLVLSAIACAGPLAIAFAQGVAAQTAAASGRVTAPVAHDNLAFYFLRGSSAPGPVPLTLAEALGRGGITVHETGNVSQLQVENTGEDSVFIQAGDIVKGGQQDRVLTVSLLLPPKSGKLPIGAFCVEQGRWAARGKEDVKRFASAEQSVPSREAKLVMLAPVKPRAEPAPTAGANPVRQGNVPQAPLTAPSRSDNRQSEVWANVGKIQDKLSANLNATVAAAQSASSLQLSLENEKLSKARAGYTSALSGAVDGKPDIVGVVIAINGRLSSAEVYPSNGLFRKMWPKLLDAGATEAIADKAEKVDALPTTAQVLAFLDAADAGKPIEDAKLDAGNARELKDSAASIAVATKRPDGKLVHKSYLAK